MNAATNGSKSYATINGITYENTPEEKLARETSHSSLHAFERLEGIARSEPLALMIESLLEVEYSQGKMARPLPFILS